MNIWAKRCFGGKQLLETCLLILRKHHHCGLGRSPGSSKNDLSSDQIGYLWYGSGSFVRGGCYTGLGWCSSCHREVAVKLGARLRDGPHGKCLGLAAPWAP